MKVYVRCDIILAFCFVAIGFTESGELTQNLMYAPWSILHVAVTLRDLKDPCHEAPLQVIEREHPKNCIVVCSHNEVRPLRRGVEGGHGPYHSITLTQGGRVVLLFRPTSLTSYPRWPIR